MNVRVLAVITGVLTEVSRGPWKKLEETKIRDNYYHLNDNVVEIS